jgi:hypothetical protein
MTFITSCTNNYFEYVSAFSYKYLKITILFLFIHENTLKHPGSNKQSISKPSRNFLENKRPEKKATQRTKCLNYCSERIFMRQFLHFELKIAIIIVSESVMFNIMAASTK